MKIITLLLIILLPLNVSAQDANVLQEAQRHLNNIRTIKAEFTQIAPDGAASTGMFYMQRPGKMRWQYNPPVPVIMVSRGSFMRYIDTELDQVSDIPLQGTLAELLAQDRLDFSDKKLKILRADAQDNVAVISVTQRTAPDEGELTFEFEQRPLKLRNIILKDAQGEETNISLSDAEYNIKLDPALFELENSHLNNRRRNRR